MKNFINKFEFQSQRNDMRETDIACLMSITVNNNIYNG